MSTSVHGSKLYESFKDQALDRNDKSIATWDKYKNDLDATKSLLNMISKKVKHEVMVPIGPKALVPGKVVHTNEFLVNLGETWFTKRSAFQAIEICDRRIKQCEEMLKKLEKERQLIISKTSLPAEQEAFGSSEKPEIIEYVTEEENEEWKKQHRLREKEYREKLAELRNREKKPVETEEDLWNRLDELELQEELEDELNKLNAENSSDECTDEENSQLSEKSSQNDSDNETLKEGVKVNSDVTVDSKFKRKISFACDSNSSDDEPLILKIKHSDIAPVSSDSNPTDIVSPSDIYNKYLHSISRTPSSILRSDVNPNRKEELQMVEKIAAADLNEKEESEEKFNITTGIHINDITEKNLNEVCSNKIVETKNKKVSKFKASRVKNS